jgi:phosphate transport system permease protein
MRPRRRWSWTFFCSLALTLLAASFLGGLFILFVCQSLPVWRHEGLSYLNGIRWFYRDARFGSLPMLYGSAVVSLIAMVLAGPIGIGAGIFISEYLPARWRLPVKVAVELLAGVPSVVYGLLGILFLRNWIYWALTPFDPISGDTLLTAGLLLVRSGYPAFKIRRGGTTFGVSFQRPRKKDAPALRKCANLPCRAYEGRLRSGQ